MTPLQFYQVCLFAIILKRAWPGQKSVDIVSLLEMSSIEIAAFCCGDLAGLPAHCDVVLIPGVDFAL